MLTLAEAAKLAQTPLQRGVIELFPRTSIILQHLPFLNVSSDSYKYNIEQSLPGVAFRGINETYTESTGVINPATETLAILGGVVDVDRVLLKTQGNLQDIRALHTGLKAKAMALRFSKEFIKGDSAIDTKSFDGLQKRLTGSQLIAAGSTSGGDVLTLNLLDQLIDAVQGGPDLLLMNATMRRQVNKLIRAAGQATEVVSDAFGKQLMAYAGIPIGIVENDEAGNAILPFTEANPGGGTAASTSIYACSFGAGEKVSGLQCGGLSVVDHGLISGTPVYRTDFEWVCGCAVFHPKSAARLHGLRINLPE